MTRLAAAVDASLPGSLTGSLTVGDPKRAAQVAAAMRLDSGSSSPP